MVDIPELCLINNRCGGMSLVLRAGHTNLYNPVNIGKYWGCSKNTEGCKGAMWTNLNVAAVIKQKDHIESYLVDIIL
ncbi:hypothetical protein T11_6519 [Trichinella zimbabwensis]|uniref:FLYWCH-type domain-containing protein n=1 Tax=Trichinella zimbabwensis TaxID=268475 RepID=A0A0V1I3F6_9BILA|nr:hypothetical protein T11_6519 [Trichinella zimbabwensis]